MKLVIELDEQMENEWEVAKESLEHTFKWAHKHLGSLTDSEVLRGLLFCFEITLGESADQIFVSQFSDEDVAQMQKRSSSSQPLS